MKKLLSILLSLALTLSLASVAFAEEEKALNIFTWATYIDAETLDNFTKETGIKINYTNFQSNEEMLIKMQQAGNSFDLILASDYAVNILRKEDRLYPLNKEWLPNFSNLDPAFLSQYFDEKNEYAVPYTAGTPLIVVNPKLVDLDIDGYESLWNPALKDNIVIIDDARNIIGITLKTMGESFNTTDPAILDKAKAKLMELRPNIRAFNYDTPHLDMIAGEVGVGYMFTPFVLLAMDGNPDLKVVYPKEGMGFGIDALVISKDAPHPENAHKLINHLLDAKVGAHVAEMQYYLSPNAAAREFINPALANNPAINIPKDILGQTEFIKDVGEAESLFQSIWTEFKLK